MDSRLRNTVLAGLLGFALVQLDVSIVNVALVSLKRDFRIETAHVAWIVDAYAIAFACALLPGGALGDRIGAKRTFLGGFAVFGVASIGCAFASSIGVLVAMRVLQGIGASTLVPCSLALITHAAGSDARERARAVAVWTAAGSVALAAGPVAGGVLIATVGWRAIFFINIPFCIAAMLLTQRLTEETEPRPGRVDVLGGALAVIALLGTATGVIEGGALGFEAPVVRAGFALAAIGGAAFLIVESRLADPMVPLAFFRNATFRSAVGVGLAINAALYGTLFMLAVYLQQSRGYSPLTVGFAFIPFAVALGLANLAAGRFVARWGSRGPILAGLALALAGFALLFAAGPHTPYGLLLPALIVLPSGIGVAVPAMTSALLGEIPRERSGVASGVLNTVRQAAGALGVAVTAALLARAGLASGMLWATALFTLLFAAAIVLTLTGIAPATGTKAA